MTQQRYKVKKGDYVEVIAGKDKGRRGEIARVFLDEGRVLVDGINVVTRFAKPSYSNPDGAFRKSLPVHISNVALIDSTTDKPGRIGCRINVEGKKERYFKKTGAVVTGLGAKS